MTAAECLRKAADLIERDGWCQGSYQNETGRCLVGALDWVANEVRDQWPRPNYEARWLVIDMLGVYGVGLEVGWNDTPGRTADEVTEILRAAADLDDVENGRVPL